MQNVKPTTDPARPKQSLRSWFDTRNRNVGTWAFALNRLTGIGLTVYLFLHLAVLSLLLQGEAGWDGFVAIAKHPLFLTLDVILLFGVLFHGLNGIRVAMVGIGAATRNHKTMFWVLSAIGLVLFLVGAYLIYFG